MKDVLAVIGALALVLLCAIFLMESITWLHKVNDHLFKGHIDLQHQVDTLEQRVMLNEGLIYNSHKEVTKVMYDGLDNRLKALENKPNAYEPKWNTLTNYIYSGNDYLVYTGKVVEVR